MSDFLLNLARRSAGLAPAVQSHVDPTAEVAGADGDDAVSDAAPLPPLAGSMTAAPADPLNPPAMMAPVSTAILERPIASLSVPLVQREPMAAVAVTAPAPAVIPPAASPPPALEARSPVPAPQLSFPIEAVGVPASRTEPALQDPARSPARIVERHFESRVEHELTRVVEQTALHPREIVRIDVVQQEAHPRQTPIVESSPAQVELVPRFEPASEPALARPVSRAPWPAEPPQQAVERTVQVRIGTIEIHGSDAAPAAPLPPPPSAQEFDAFARLRSYAPWSW